MSEIIEGGEAQLFVYEEGDNIALYPYIKRSIYNEQDSSIFYDIETAYGYGGPIVKIEDIAFENAFEMNFLQHCQQENIIAEFITQSNNSMDRFGKKS